MRPFFPLLCLAGLVLVTMTPSQPLAGEGEGTSEPQADRQDGTRIRKIGPNLYRVGSVVLDSEKRTVRCPGRVNMDAGGPIELLACLPRGKTHESVFTLDVEPTDLQVALLLLGLKPGRNPAFEYAEDSPELERPPGDEALIFVQWPRTPSKEDGEVRSCRAEKFLYNVPADTPAAEATWVFMGSRMVGKGFGADLDGSLVTTYHDPLAILELCAPTVNDDIYYFVNERQCPPVGTQVALVVEALPKEDAEGGQGERAEAKDE